MINFLVLILCQVQVLRHHIFFVHNGNVTIFGFTPFLIEKYAGESADDQGCYTCGDKVLVSKFMGLSKFTIFPFPVFILSMSSERTARRGLRAFAMA